MTNFRYADADLSTFKRVSPTTDEVVIRKIVTEEVENPDNSGEINSVTPISPCQTTVQPVIMEQVGKAEQTKGQEQVLKEHDKSAACCRKQAVRTVRKTDSENRNEEELGEIKRLIGLYSLEEVKKALEVDESDI